MNLTAVQGTTGTGQTVTMLLVNTSTRPALALFNLAWRRKSSGGGSDASICTGCGNRWNVEAKEGISSVGGMGVATSIVPSGSSTFVVQTLSAVRPFAEVGALFPAMVGTVPSVIGGGGFGQNRRGRRDAGAAVG